MKRSTLIGYIIHVPLGGERYSVTLVSCTRTQQDDPARIKPLHPKLNALTIRLPISHITTLIEQSIFTLEGRWPSGTGENPLKHTSISTASSSSVSPAMILSSLSYKAVLTWV